MPDVLTVAAGTLSGGISASVSGGNFWQGARQGAITSGLNHIADHYIQGHINKKRLEKALEGKGYKNPKNIKVDFDDSKKIINNLLEVLDKCFLGEGWRTYY